MKRILQMKWLALAVCLCAPVTTWAETAETLVLTSNTYVETYISDWYSTYNVYFGTITDSAAPITFESSPNANSYQLWGAGWQNTSYWNLKSYDKIRVTYSEFSSTNTNTYLQLLIQDADGYGVYASSDPVSTGASGKIEFTVKSSNANGDNSSYQSGTVNFEQIEYLMIQGTAACTVTINSVEFVTNDPSDNVESNDTYSADFDLSTGDANFTTAGTYKVKGDGTTGHYTLVFPDEASGTYNITLHNVGINTIGRSSSASKGMSRTRANRYTEDDATELNCGIYIPASTENSPLQVYLTLEGENTLDASKYGIYVGENSELTIYTTGVVDTGWGKIKDPDTETLTIGSSSDDNQIKYGIYNEGKLMTIQGTVDGVKNQTVYVGTTTIYAETCGINTPRGINVDATYLTIYVSGDGSVSASDSAPGYTINTLVCGIYVNADLRGSESNIMNFAMIYLTIEAKGTQTYGLFLDADTDTSSGKAYFGFGQVEITATQCVMHHEALYSAYGSASKTSEGDEIIFIFHGPFCEHPNAYSNGNDWFCDGTNSGEGVGSSFGEDSNIYIIQDGDDMDGYYTDWNIHYKTNVPEVEYIGRNLYAGWNTLCLPYAYKVISDDDVDEEHYPESAGYTEARKVIDRYAIYESGSDDTYDTSEGTITFTYLDPEEGYDDDENGLVLKPDVAYLVWIDDQTDAAKEGKKDYCIKVKFTAMDADLIVATNHDETNEIFFDPVFDQEKMSGDQISGDSDDTHHHYKLTAHNSYTEDESDGTILVDENDEDTYETSGYTYYGVANYFNKTADDNVIFPAYRCYIDITATDDDDAGAKLLTIMFDDGETTGIDQLNGGTLNAAKDGNSVVSVYGIDGKFVKVSTEKTATNGLSKGVYVVNGKKVVVM